MNHTKKHRPLSIDIEFEYVNANYVEIHNDIVLNNWHSILDNNNS